jgi:hypothetical protein
MPLGEASREGRLGDAMIGAGLQVEPPAGALEAKDLRELPDPELLDAVDRR